MSVGLLTVCWASGLCRNDGNGKRKHGNGNMESTAHALVNSDLISDAALAHVLFKSVSAPVLSHTQLPRFPDQGRLFGGSFCLLIHLLDVW